MFHTRVKAASRIGPHNLDVISVIVGSLLKKNHFCTNVVNDNILNPNWVTGFIDGEGSFIVSIIKSKDRALGWRVSPIFALELHGKDIDLLYKMKSFFLG